MARTYTEFIKSKEIESINAGISFDESELNKNLMPFQRDIVAWALRKGRAEREAERMKRKMDTIGNRLNGLLSEHDLSQRELSAEINVAHSTISRIISGNVIPSGRVLIELADYFCVSIDWLVGRE